MELMCYLCLANFIIYSYILRVLITKIKVKMMLNG